MRARIIDTTILVASLIGGPWASAAAPTKPLVFEGTVASISVVNDPLTLKPWLVTVKVTKIVSGEFSGSTFEFRVHSPALSGLEKGRSYTVEAIWKDNGYQVDQNQWQRPKQPPSETR